jgi:V/A-type H+-transporting ATPase subunit A
VRAFWALDKQLANARHYPSVSWLESYTEYADDVAEWWEEKTQGQWKELREKIASIMQREARLERVVKLVGADVLPDSQRLILEVARMFKDAFLQQNAFDEVDAFCVPEKQYRMLKIIVSFYTLGSEAIKKGGTLVGLKKLPLVRDIMQMKFECPNDQPERLDQLQKKLEESIGEFGNQFA